MNNNTKLNQVLMQGLAIPETMIDESLSYQSIPEWDSMAHMYLMSEIEQTFGISLDTTDMLEMTSVENIRKKLAQHQVVFEQEA
ncbi:acyl carrier protein [Taibaiella helva]|uniref:acyl carrier protein n=1 Tax=Taibaiella helva TaxID=2301235 RepID=UPI0018E4F318|nr:acyl carrier protein [Taibaiella helva]